MRLNVCVCDAHVVFLKDSERLSLRSDHDHESHQTCQEHSHISAQNIEIYILLKENDRLFALQDYVWRLKHFKKQAVQQKLS